VRDDLDVLGTDTGNYSIAVRTALEDGTRIAVDRGYAQARVELAGAPFTFLTTHLESVAESIRVGQATELAGVVRGIDGPVIVAGDLNTTPDGDQSAAYRRLVGGRAGLTDAWAATRDDAGPTCCQNATLRNEQSGLGIRVDMVLTGGAATPFAIRRTDTDPTDRVLATTPEGQARLWPSDHAGVVADVLVEPTTRDPWPVLRGLLFGG
jgi:endonuclease/exonuclease/phosphatase family metal-dependent hydrolase